MHVFQFWTVNSLKARTIDAIFENLLGYNLHTINFTYLKAMVQWCSVYSVLETIIVLEFCHHSKETLCLIAVILHLVPLSPALATINLLLSMNLPHLSRIYNHTLCGFCDWVPSFSIIFQGLSVL